MTEPNSTEPAVLETGPDSAPEVTYSGDESTASILGTGGHGYSQDYWDIVFEQLAQRTLFKVGIAILAVLYSVAVFAPLIANDRPFSLEAIDTRDYNESLRRPRLAARSVAELATRAEAEPEFDLATSLDAEVEGKLERLAILRSYLAEADEVPLNAFEKNFDAAVAAARAGDFDAARLAAETAQDDARFLRSELKPLAPDAEEGSEGVVLQPVRSHPLWESIEWWEVGLMALNILLLFWPIWNLIVNRVLLGGDRERIRHARQPKIFVVLGLTAAAAVLWTMTVNGDRGEFAAGPYKKGLTSGQIVAVGEPNLPFLPYGYAETHAEENFRPPTWAANAEVDEFGRRANQSADAAAVPVEVLYGEPAINDWDRHIAGVDELGRDFLVRIVWGARVSLAVGILSAFLLTVIGVTIGSIAGYFGGRIDVAIMRVIEILQSIPAFFLILATMSFTDPETVPPMFAIIVVIALIRWTGVARLVRGEFLKLREQEFVVAAESLGFSSRRTMFKHILPNAMSPVLVSAAFAVASGILTESAVSFLGFGVQAPNASWGSLINESRDPTHWWVQLFPGVLIFLTVTCYNLVGDAVRDALDPKMKV